MSALDDIRETASSLNRLRVKMTDVIADHDIDGGDAVDVLRSLVHLESILTGALRELQTPEDPGPVETPKASEEPAQEEDDPAEGSLVLDLLDRQNLRAALDRLERGIVDLAGVRDQDGAALHDVADAAKVFRYELELDGVQP